MSKKKVLVFIDWYLPGFKAGGPIRSCANLVEHLGAEFEFSIVTRNSDYTESKAYPGIISDSWNQQPDGSRIYYFSEEKLRGKNIRHLISTTDYDAVYLNGIYSVYFTLYPLIYLRKKRDKLIVVAVRGMLNESAISIKKTKKIFFLRAVKVLRLFNRVVFHATSADEQKDIENQFGSKNKILLAGNLPAKNNLDTNPVRLKESGSVSCVIVARISPEKNLMYALQILQKVKDVQVAFDIYGPVYDEAYWKACSDLISAMPANIRIRYCGSIANELVAGTLSRYHFLFMPTSGENFGHIILQALSAGCPVLISDRTPWRDIQMKKAGWDLPLEKDELFVSVIQECGKLSQPEFNLLSQNAFAYARHYQNDLKVLEENRRLFQ